MTVNRTNLDQVTQHDSAMLNCACIERFWRPWHLLLSEEYNMSNDLGKGL